MGAQKAAATLVLGAETPVVFVPPVAAPDGDALCAYDSHELLEKAAHASLGVRRELARHVVDYLVDQGPDAQARYRRLTQARLDDNLSTIKGRPDLTVDAELYGDKSPFEVPWFSQAFPTADRADLERRLWQAKNIHHRLSRGDIPAAQEYWQQDLDEMAFRNLRADIVMADTLIYLDDHMADANQADIRTLAAAMLANQLDPDALMRVVDDIDPHCGITPGTADGKPIFETARHQNHISALALTTRHWDEVNAAGAYPAGIDLKAANARLYPAAVVEPVGTAVTSVEALDQARAAPDVSATVVPLFTAARPAP